MAEKEPEERMGMILLLEAPYATQLYGPELTFTDKGKKRYGSSGEPLPRKGQGASSTFPWASNPPKP
jgi:hypothetical protein